MVGVFGAAVAAVFAWRGYVLARWQAKHDYYDWCEQLVGTSQVRHSHPCKIAHKMTYESNRTPPNICVASRC